jgi:hypothetical protein
MALAMISTGANVGTWRFGAARRAASARALAESTARLARGFGNLSETVAADFVARVAAGRGIDLLGAGLGDPQAIQTALDVQRANNPACALKGSSANNAWRDKNPACAPEGSSANNGWRDKTPSCAPEGSIVKIDWIDKVIANNPACALEGSIDKIHWIEKLKGEQIRSARLIARVGGWVGGWVVEFSA